MYTVIYCNYGPMMTNNEMEFVKFGLLNEFTHYRETAFFYSSPYSGSNPCFTAFGIDVKCDIEIFKQFDISTFIKGIDEVDMKSKYDIALEKFKTEMVKLEFWNDLKSDEKVILDEILSREPKLYFYFGTS